MAYTGTITSKRQLTIPAKLFKQLGLVTGEKVSIRKKDGLIVIELKRSVIEQDAGSLAHLVPPALRGVAFKKVRALARDAALKEKYKK
ncbi:MAG: hypothetical protein COV60_02535 [Candidatus Magasanikbacteria bacterium CG11_big_fil_rev_8_21_14_0_20_43_7]|uniref:SpoVT-AbrB domain-containing protein n=1 Tax=Candidatus Magasanikbacteria bacterium CG11_big_fil_rev_8_21_14_0_20_43_7 TaxID=1974654 RepID=A0A2H0N2A6_9BACT|nr:MAG: hypothetical protein COV60_02535 [Candidatus Magasanikbacteria bacterium CG11_big_fil_rev_8_21_14_0_20_43_7]